MPEAEAAKSPDDNYETDAFSRNDAEAAPPWARTS